MKALLRIMRVHQYVKNLFIFLPVFFGLQITNSRLMLMTALAFLFFSLTASAMYIVNDIRDCEDDQKHPVKKDRPVASGAVTKKAATLLAAILAAAGLTGALLLNRQMFMITLVYVLINILYTTVLKHVAIVDIMVIAVGFVLRLFVGSSVSGVHLSMWIIIMTFLLAIFLALAKRREDVALYIDMGEKARKVIDGYNIEFLNISMYIMAAVIIISYVMYTISPLILNRPHGDKIYLTMLWVVAGILRYLQLTLVFNSTGSPTRVLLTDRFLQIVLAGWVLSFWILIYL
ncbi:MAG: UbiA prenyltransferase family protein [Spirochaetes bacterium]|nr:UbiA prenyltransferase family protein [Spirochaetota bacterium]